jgi:hypothetical protein
MIKVLPFAVSVALALAGVSAIGVLDHVHQTPNAHHVEMISTENLQNTADTGLQSDSTIFLSTHGNVLVNSSVAAPSAITKK